MKLNREIITVILFFLLLTFCTSALLNTVNVSRRMSQITEEAISMTDGGKPDKNNLALLDAKINELSDGWMKYEPIVSTYSRHDELERVSSAVKKLRPLYDSGQYDELYLTLHETDDALDHLRKTELPTIANIL